MKTRKCEFCRDWTPEYLEEYYGVTEMECGACGGTKVLDIRDCFCAALLSRLSAVVMQTGVTTFIMRMTE